MVERSGPSTARRRTHGCVERMQLLRCGHNRDAPAACRHATTPRQQQLYGSLHLLPPSLPSILFGGIDLPALQVRCQHQTLKEYGSLAVRAAAATPLQPAR
eukprot:362430-Chlamydomonas_euryale.AAC.2